MKKIWPILLALLMLMGCNERSTTPHQEIFMAGQIAGRDFVNPRMGVSLQLPEGWHTADLEQIRKAQRHGAQTMKSDLAMASVKNPDLPGVYPLLTVSKYPLSQPLPKGVSHNPSLYMVAKRRQVGASLSDVMGVYETLGPPCELARRPTPVTCGDAKGMCVVMQIRYPAAVITQDIYGFSTPHYVITVAISTMQDSDRMVLRRCLNRLGIKHNSEPSA